MQLHATSLAREEEAKPGEKLVKAVLIEAGKGQLLCASLWLLPLIFIATIFCSHLTLLSTAKAWSWQDCHSFQTRRGNSILGSFATRVTENLFSSINRRARLTRQYDSEQEGLSPGNPNLQFYIFPCLLHPQFGRRIQTDVAITNQFPCSNKVLPM